MSDFNIKDYNEGYQAGLAKSKQSHDDAYWLRQYAGMAMQGYLTTYNTETGIYLVCIYKEELACGFADLAGALLDEIKRREKENDKQ
jgi:hypothetical protein